MIPVRQISPFSSQCVPYFCQQGLVQNTFSKQGSYHLPASIRGRIPSFSQSQQYVKTHMSVQPDQSTERHPKIFLQPSFGGNLRNICKPDQTINPGHIITQRSLTQRNATQTSTAANNDLLFQNEQSKTVRQINHQRDINSDKISVPLMKSCSQGQIFFHVEDKKGMVDVKKIGAPKIRQATQPQPQSIPKPSPTSAESPNSSTRISEEYFQLLRKKYLAQYTNIRNRVSKKKIEKENENSFKKTALNSSKNVLNVINKQIDLIIPIVHSNNSTKSLQKKEQEQNKSIITFERIQKDLLEILLVDKELLKNQWIMYQKYDSTLKSLVSEIVKFYSKEFDLIEKSLMNGFLGINIVKKLFSYADITIEEKQLQGLFPFTISQTVSQTDIFNQIKGLFQSPNFFVKKSNEILRQINLVEMQRVMKDIAQQKIKSDELFGLFIKNYSQSELQNAKVFEYLSDDKILTPKSMSNNLQQECKPDYCLHVLYRINPENCLQISKEKFYSIFT